MCGLGGRERPALPLTYLLLFQQPNTEGIWELMTGGAFYCLGMVFFKSDGRIPFAHAIWHLFVAFGAGTHTMPRGFEIENSTHFLKTLDPVTFKDSCI